MYGIVNKSIEDLVVTNFGKEKWDIIHKKSGVNISIADKFINHIAKVSKKNVKKTDKTFNSDNIEISK